jgi:LPS export ABC transporter protein LptC
MLFRIFTVLAVIALGISTWILSSPARRLKIQSDLRQSELPGYYLKNTVLTDYDAGGTPGLRIEAERIDQIDHGSEVALYNVRVNYQPPNGVAWVMLGDVAHVQPGGSVVDVTGNVRLQSAPREADDAGRPGAARTNPAREPPGRSGIAVIHTDALRYNIPEATASTSSDVRIDFGRHTLTAHGLIANLKERTMRLESKVNGHFQP